MRKISLIAAVIAAQHTLNVNINGEGYERTLKTNKGKNIFMYGCFGDEASEMLGSTPWKHWKDIDGEVDEENLFVETVDQWHFVAMLIIVLLSAELNKPFKEVTEEEINEYISSLVFGLRSNPLGVMKHVLTEEESEDYIINKSIATIFKEAGNIGLYNCINPLLVGKVDFNSRDYAYLKQSLMIIMGTLEDLRVVLGKEEEDVYAGYIVKNTLNQFRTDNGYKEGNYNKNNWEGKEDNVVAMEILEKRPEITFNELYEELNVRYKKIQKKGK